MTVLDSLHIPTLDKQRVPVKTLIEQLQPTTFNKKLIESHVASIYLVSLLNEQTIHCRAYKDDEYSYQAIYVLQVTLKKSDQLTDLSSQLHSAFAEPTILLYTTGSKEWISAAPKRINKLDNTKTVLEDIVVQEIKTSFEQYLDISHISATDLKQYYIQIVNLVYQLSVYDLVHVFPSKDLDYKKIIKEYQSHTSSILDLEDEYKHTYTKSKQLEIDDLIYEFECKRDTLIRLLKGEQ